MTVSIIIVNYNVKYFLEQCLHSVFKAIAGLQAEVIVVDNASTDYSQAYLCQQFPQLHWIDSGGNIGFSKACNAGYAAAKGEYILFLNPDTLLAEDTIDTCLRFFQLHPKAGSVGVRMVDGSGVFLKESKRSFPSPLTSFYKLAGLSRLFPHSSQLARYHLGHLSEHSNHQVDVLAGAFMMIPGKVLNKVGVFDETFFMYGEDIDLSYRIQKTGYKNYYLADTTIIHFKGESTKRGSLNYIKLFYSAMSIFVRKHYGGAKAGLFNLAIQLAIGIRAGLTAIAKFVKWIGIPVIDAALILLSFLLMKQIWVTYVKPGIDYPDRLLWIAFPAFTFMYLLVGYYTGLYNKCYRRRDLVRSAFLATLALLSVYSLLPEQYRFSRGILSFGALLAFGIISISRRIMEETGLLQKDAGTIEKPYLLIAGTPEEYDAVKALLRQNMLENKVIGRIAVLPGDNKAITHLEGVNKLVISQKATELIFCAGVLTYKDIISHIQQKPTGIRMRFHKAGSGSIVGSDSSGTSGEVLAGEAQFRLARATERRIKRLIDVLTSLFFLLTFPVHCLLVKQPFHFLSNCLAILLKRKTWVGYAGSGKGLPPLRPGVMAPNGLLLRQQASITEGLRLVDHYYACDYEPVQDLALVFANYRHLGN